MKVIDKNTNKDVTGKVIKAIEKSLIKDGYKITKVYTSDQILEKVIKIVKDEKINTK